MTESRPNRSELLEWINVVSFAVDDVKLFLDTHPCNEDALEYSRNLRNSGCRRSRSTPSILAR